jgi:hypothetical protein
LTRGYGATNPPLTATYSGFVNGQNTNILSGEPSLLTTAATNSSVGIYPITPGSGTLAVADTNYTLAFSNGILTISPASSTSSLLSSQNPSTNGLSVQFILTVSPVAPATTAPTGSVAFLANGVFQAMAGLSNGVAQITLANLPPGTNEVAAAYLGDGNYLGSTDQVQEVVMQLPIPCAGTNFILSVVKSGADTFTISLMGTTNALYCLLKTTNVAAPMSDWILVPDSVNAATNGIWYYTITNAGAPEVDATNLTGKFFRAQAVNPCP